MTRNAIFRKEPVMRASKYCAILASLLLALGAGLPAVAQSNKMPSVEIISTSAALIFGSQSGEGILKLPNLGTNCEYPFTIEGFGAGIQVGISKLTAVGPVKNLTKVADFPGKYTSTEGESTLIAGGGVLNMQNQANKVVMDLKTRTEGLALGVGAKGLTIKLKKAITDAPRIYVLEFGFNKNWVNEASRNKLAQVIDGWKCRYANIRLIGHTDTVGKEGYNMELSDKRAKSVRNYLIGAGFTRTRITTRAAGEKEPLLQTGEGVRDRANRAVVVIVN